MAISRFTLFIISGLILHCFGNNEKKSTSNKESVMSALALGSSMTTMPEESLSISTSFQACENAIETKADREKLSKIRKLAVKIVGSTCSSLKLPRLLHSARQEIEVSHLIMVGQGLKIYKKIDDKQLSVGCLEGMPYYKYHDVEKASMQEMSTKITSIVQEARTTFPINHPESPVFDENLFSCALKGKDPSIMAFGNALKENSELIESVEKICSQMKDLIEKITGACWASDGVLADIDFFQDQVTGDLNNGLKMVTSGMRIWVKDAKIFRLDIRHKQGIKCWQEEKCSIPLATLEKAEKSVRDILGSVALRSGLDPAIANFSKESFVRAMQGEDPTIQAFTNLVADYPSLFV
jgi:hypothetical protein